MINIFHKTNIPWSEGLLTWFVYYFLRFNECAQLQLVSRKVALLHILHLYLPHSQMKNKLLAKRRWLSSLEHACTILKGIHCLHLRRKHFTEITISNWPELNRIQKTNIANFPKDQPPTGSAKRTYSPKAINPFLIWRPWQNTYQRVTDWKSVALSSWATSVLLFRLFFQLQWA